MYFDTKSYLKSTRNHTVKHALSKPANCGNELEHVHAFDLLSQLAFSFLPPLASVYKFNFRPFKALSEMGMSKQKCSHLSVKASLTSCGM